MTQDYVNAHFKKVDRNNPTIESALNKRERVFSRSLTTPNFMSSFLAKLWTLFGKPNEISDEGFSYFIQDEQSGAVFAAELTGFGPGYFCNLNDDSTIEIIKQFDVLIESLKPSDCQISFESDFGETTIGCKDGIFFENFAEEAE